MEVSEGGGNDSGSGPLAMPVVRPLGSGDKSAGSDRIGSASEPLDRAGRCLKSARGSQQSRWRRRPVASYRPKGFLGHGVV